MDPEEYQQSVKEGFGGAARLAEQLGWAVLGSLAVAATVVVCWRFRDEILGLANAALARIGRVPAAPDLIRWVLRYRAPRQVGAFVSAAGTLAVGVTVGVLQLDGGWCERHRRFWHVPAPVVEGILWVWSECRAGRSCPRSVIEYARGRDLGTWHGRLVARMVGRALLG